ncbi:hypothetical protein [Micromonospora sp. CPCC 206061]|uniref:hypothetical protein n=1 Tax=Micromonospora sp. CPCC 206061 TaxID=3122410 RepID=UPI002FF1D50A
MPARSRRVRWTAACTILFTTGASSVRPELGHDMFGNVAPAAAWLRNWAHGLHAAAPRGVQVGQ